MKPISNSYQVAAIIQQSKKVFKFMVIAQTQIALCILYNEQFIEKTIDYLVLNSLWDILNQ
jgi:3-oxoacyl-[acyl-carrier-protein] synthase III